MQSALSRRGFLQIGSLALGGLTLPELLQAQEATGASDCESSVIMLYQHGGASHMETYDLKPDAPTSYRSVFNPIATNVAGLDICELFPLQAKIADKFSLVRSLHHDVGIHSDGGIITLTGKRPTVLDPTSQSKSDHPDFGSVTSHFKGHGKHAMPPYVTIPRSPYMTRPTYLGLHHSGFESGDPNSTNFQPPQVKQRAKADSKILSDRRALLRSFDRLRSDLDTRDQLAGVDEFRRIAFEMMTSPRVAGAFAVDREPDELRDRYGRNQWGQACLLARRLAEAGSKVINIYFNTPKSGQEFTNWDDHILNAGRPGHFAKYMRVRLPYMDQALSALIEDIYQRDLDKRILVVVVGEFGRTPRLSHNSSGTGRNHWPQANSALLSGGGLRMGQVVGATNSKGEYPTRMPLTPQDLLATVYRHLGIDPSATLINHAGRPVPILESGSPIAALI